MDKRRCSSIALARRRYCPPPCFSFGFLIVVGSGIIPPREDQLGRFFLFAVLSSYLFPLSVLLEISSTVSSSSFPDPTIRLLPIVQLRCDCSVSSCRARSEDTILFEFIVFARQGRRPPPRSLFFFFFPEPRPYIETTPPAHSPPSLGWFFELSNLLIFPVFNFLPGYSPFSEGSSFRSRTKLPEGSYFF